jgi:S1-C subfamily serine protease
LLEKIGGIRYNERIDGGVRPRRAAVAPARWAMRAIVRVLPLLLLVGLVPARGQDRPRLADVRALQEAVQQVIDRAEPSIACILVSRSEAYGPPPAVPGRLGRFDASRLLPPEPGPRRQKVLDLDLSNPDTVPESYGSGVVLDATGLVLTHAHVVHKATKIYVRLPGQRGSWADIHALDPRSDLAVLRLLDPPPDFHPLKLGDGGKLRKGTFVLSLANPFAAGFRDGSPTASWGMVGNVRRRAPGMTNDVDRTRLTLHHYGTLVQTDVRLNIGCSGGALLNLDGELVGLTTATAALSGGETPGGFAVPLDAGMRRIIEVLRRGEEVEYGFLGVFMATDSKPGRPVLLKDVAHHSPAQRAGLQAGLWIQSINGTPVQEIDDLFLLIGTQLAGNTVRIEASRTPQGPPQMYTVKLAKYFVPGTPIASHRPAARAGLRVDYTSGLASRPGGIPDGVLVREVLPGSPAERARLGVETLILRVNGKPVATPAEFYQEMDHAAGPVELTVRNSDDREERVTLDGK